jgi:hypothetical protein
MRERTGMKNQFIIDGDILDQSFRKLKGEIKRLRELQAPVPQKGDTILKITYIGNARKKGISLRQLAESIIKVLRGSAFNSRNQICEQQIVRKIDPQNPRTIIEVEVV